MKKYNLKSEYCGGSKRWTDSDLCAAVKTNTTLHGVLIELGIDPQGSNYRTIRKRINVLGIDVSHINSGRNWSKGKTTNRGRELKEYLVLDGPTISSTWLKERMLREKLLKEVCTICGIQAIWNRKKNLFSD